MTWRILTLACVDTRADHKAACVVCYRQESEHGEELGGGMLTLVGPAAFMHLLS